MLLDPLFATLTNLSTPVILIGVLALICTRRLVPGYQFNEVASRYTLACGLLSESQAINTALLNKIDDAPSIVGEPVAGPATAKADRLVAARRARVSQRRS